MYKYTYVYKYTNNCKTAIKHISNVISFKKFKSVNLILKINQSILKMSYLNTTCAQFPLFRCRSSVAISPFCRCKIPLFCKNYVRKFRSVRHRDMQRQWQRCTETATANGNGEMATEERNRSGGNRALVFLTMLQTSNWQGKI